MLTLRVAAQLHQLEDIDFAIEQMGDEGLATSRACFTVHLGQWFDK